MKKLLSIILGLLLLASVSKTVEAAKPADKGFNEYGYNYNARIFNGTGYQWCMGKYGYDATTCDTVLGPYAGDNIVMKWNAEWDRGNTENWSNPPYEAWTSNEWNGMNGGTGSVWHYKIIWVGSELEESPYWREGGYPIWGQFEVIMDQGIDPSYGPGHFWFAHGIPTGYGVYP